MLDLTGIRQGEEYKAIGIKKNIATGYVLKNIPADEVVLNRSLNNIVEMRHNGKFTSIVTFTGLKDPLESEKPAIQMKVRSVQSHQKSSNPLVKTADENINVLADSDWKDGQPLDFYIKETLEGNQIMLSAPGIGDIGRVHDEVAQTPIETVEESYSNQGKNRPKKSATLADLIKQHPSAFKFELSNVIAGTSKGAETIGLRVNLKYQGAGGGESIVKRAFNNVLNNPECADKVLLYQSPASPEEVLKIILDYEKKNKGPVAEAKMKEVIDNIINAIKDPANKNILLIGHDKPDGDTIGSTLGLMNAIKLASPDKKVDCAIDDKIPGLFRHKLPGIDNEIKRAPERIYKIQEGLDKLKSGIQDDQAKNQERILEQEIQEMNPAKLLDPKVKYDLVILMDIPTPQRFTKWFKPYIEGANKVIYIDHHPHRISEWRDAAQDTGVNIDNSHKNGLAWIADAVPSATQLASIIAFKLLPQLSDIGQKKVQPTEVFKTQEQLDRLKSFVASIVAGASTDTGSFTRTANLLPEHTKLPVQERPNFMPEGESKYLMNMTQDIMGKDGISKKWIREEITYDIPDEEFNQVAGTSRNLMLEYAIKGKVVYPDLSLGIINVNYDDMDRVWQSSRKSEELSGKNPETTLLDVQNSFKYSEVMGTLRADPSLNKNLSKVKPEQAKTLSDFAKLDYSGRYDNDRIAALIMQDKKAGKLDEKMNVSDSNRLRLSFRSQEGSIHAELLANLFRGGGHGAAAGGRVDLPGVGVETKLSVKINGKFEKNPAVILKELNKNYDIMRSSEIAEDDKQKLCANFEMVLDPTGKTCSDIILDMVKEIRANQKINDNPFDKDRDYQQNDTNRSHRSQRKRHR